MSDSRSPTTDGETPTYRRRYVRVASAFPVTFVADGTDETMQGDCSDLGGGGVRLATSEDLPLGALLLLRFKLPGRDREVVTRGRIVLSFYNAEQKRFFHGIAFTQISAADQEEIVKHVASEVQRLAVDEEHDPLL